jgi:hypothetical protein
MGFRWFSLVLLDRLDMVANSFRAGGDRMRPGSLWRQLQVDRTEEDAST